MSELLSHPDRTLSDHVAEVHEAADALWGAHSGPFGEVNADVREWLQQAVSLHDAGKGSEAFQQYIVAPERWRGRSAEKRHAPLSMLCALSCAEEGGWSWQTALGVAAAVAGHHSGWHTGDGLENLLASDDAVLRKQVETLPWDSLSSALGTALVPLASSEDLVDPSLDVLEDCLAELRRLPPDSGVRYRLRAQLCLSVLLEADKAFLALEPEVRERYLIRRPPKLGPELVDGFLKTKPSTPLDGVRRRARHMVLSALDHADDERVHTVALPTGSGKTLLAASWALRLREQLTAENHAPKIVVVLPYLSIIDQTQKEYTDLFRESAPTGLILQSHSLSERVVDPELDGNTNDFFVDTWQSDIVITTFDQFLYALLAPEARHLMRFHNLCDALIVMDEIQTLPCKLWDPLSRALEQLTTLGNTRLLAMSATQPGFLRAPCDLTPERGGLFSELGRYELKLRHREPLLLEDLVADVVGRLDEWEGKRVLLTLNTRRSARVVRDALAKGGAEPLYFLTADVTPADRLAAIGEIKQGEPCIVVSTQCIEAGVDLDMDSVIRDFAPLDSLIQVAGRCNRNGCGERGTIEVVCLVGDNGRQFSLMIYDQVLLQTTRTVLGDSATLPEEDILPLTEAYFEILKRELNHGEAFTKAWARWEDTESVRSLLRGDSEQVTFVVVERDPDLEEALEQVTQIGDRWEKRRAIRQLAGRLAKVSVSVYAKKDLDPQDFAKRDATGNFWLLNRGYYRPETGLQLAPPEEEEAWGWML